MLRATSDLSAAVDVYAEWVDACDAVAKNDARGATERGASSSFNDGMDGPPTRAPLPDRHHNEYEDEGIDDTAQEEMYDDE